MKAFPAIATAEILPAGEEHLPTLVELAGVIWRQHYPGIISHEQIDYMLGQMYAVETLRKELRQGVRFYRLVLGGRFVGFASIGSVEAGTPRCGVRTVQRAVPTYKLHKLYLSLELHGSGLGSRLLQFCENEVRRLGARRLVLAVNKRNVKAISTYERNGFSVVESVVTDFGSGFVMDDFIMAKDLA